MEKKWEIRKSKVKSQKLKVRSENIIEQLLANRGLGTEREIEEFFNPPAPQTILDSSDLLDQNQISKAVKLVKSAIDRSVPIVVWGDYDVDGICGTAILWEAIYRGLGYKNVKPYIPDRFTEGYGLSNEGIKRLRDQEIKRLGNQGKILLITTDCGITSVDKVKYAKELGFDVIITDHHQKGETLPEADAILWTENLAGVGIAWVLASKIICGDFKNSGSQKAFVAATHGSPESEDKAGHAPQLQKSIYGRVYSQLDLLALATVADLQPLLGANRALVKTGLEELNKLERPGIKALVGVSGLEKKRIGTYEIGWMIAPRLNAAGRLDTAMDALRLLCTKNYAQTEELARKLSQVNKERQDQTEENFAHAMDSYQAIKRSSYQDSKVVIINHQSYHEGVIGLVAGRLVQKFHRPAIVISRGEKFSKGSARSISTFNIIEAIRRVEHIVENAGGHPMAAGFTIRTERIEEFTQQLIDHGGQVLSDDDLRPTIKIDCGIGLSDISEELWENLTKFEPHGIGNPRPLFLTRGVKVINARAVGSEGKHLKLLISDPLSFVSFKAIAFGFGNWSSKIHLGDRLDIVYSVQENIWNGKRNLELVIKDLRPSRN